MYVYIYMLYIYIYYMYHINLRVNVVSNDVVFTVTLNDATLSGVDAGLDASLMWYLSLM